MYAHEGLASTLRYPKMLRSWWKMPVRKGNTVWLLTDLKYAGRQTRLRAAGTVARFQRGQFKEHPR